MARSTKDKEINTNGNLLDQQWKKRREADIRQKLAKMKHCSKQLVESMKEANNQNIENSAVEEPTFSNSIMSSNNS